MAPFKIRDSWCEELSDILRSRIRYSSREAIGEQWHGRLLAQGSVGKVNGNRNVTYLDRNDSKRNLNLNWWDNDWNSNYRFLAVRHSQCFSWDFVSGVLFKSCRFQPPSILPISANLSAKWAYFLLSSALISHDNCNSSLIKSTFEMPLFNSSRFSSVCV